MKKVICVDAENLNLTNGKYYNIVQEGSANYLIQNDLGVCDWYSKSRFRPVPEAEYQYGQEVECEGKIGKYIAKSPDVPLGSHIVEIKESAGHWILHYFNLSDIRPIQSIRDKVIAEILSYRNTSDTADRIIEIVKGGEK